MPHHLAGSKLCQLSCYSNEVSAAQTALRSLGSCMHVSLSTGLQGTKVSYLPLREELFLTMSLPSVFSSTAQHGVSRALHPGFSSGTA